MLKLGVLVSGGGTNLQAIMDAIDAGVITNAEVGLVISNNKGAYALKRAENKGIPARCISPKDYADRKEFHKALLAELQENQVDHRGSISKSDHQYPSVTDPVFLWNRILWTSCP